MRVEGVHKALALSRTLGELREVRQQAARCARGHDCGRRNLWCDTGRIDSRHSRTVRDRVRAPGAWRRHRRGACQVVAGDATSSRHTAVRCHAPKPAPDGTTKSSTFRSVTPEPTDITTPRPSLPATPAPALRRPPKPFTCNVGDGEWRRVSGSSTHARQGQYTSPHEACARRARCTVRLGEKPQHGRANTSAVTCTAAHLREVVGRHRRSHHAHQHLAGSQVLRHRFGLNPDT